MLVMSRFSYSTRSVVLCSLAVSAAAVLAVLFAGPTNRNVTQSSYSAPWIVGPRNARFTIVAYLDLRCPYCRSYLPQLLSWVRENPETNLQWHHLPLTSHEPDATALARFAECAGIAGGDEAFWQAATWLYQNESSSGFDLPRYVKSIDRKRFVGCVDDSEPDALIRNQAQTALSDGIAGTPSLRIVDTLRAKDLTLAGPVESDALLSAIDWLVSMPAAHAESAARESGGGAYPIVGGAAEASR
jgi:protein-disulfide isomerase